MPAPSSSTSTISTTSTTLSTTLVVDTTRKIEPEKTQSILEFVEDYDNEFEASSGGINDEIIAATNVNSALFPKYYRRAVGFTVYGESCYDPCEKRDGYNYYWCHKFKDSNIGTWSDADFCSTDNKLTTYGDKCIDKCAKRGQNYFWCHKESTLWGYCTPDHLIEQLKQNQISRELLLLSIG